MQLEEYFDFLAPDDIRVRGTRVGIETILLDYLEAKLAPEAIAATYPSLSLEQVYATITYYLHNQTTVDAYLQAWKAHDADMRRQHAVDLAALRERLQTAKAFMQPQPKSTRFVRLSA